MRVRAIAAAAAVALGVLVGGFLGSKVLVDTFTEQEAIELTREASRRNCRAINHLGGQFVAVLELARDTARSEDRLDATAREFYRDAIAGLAPIPCD